jgi:hypothetical protein
MLALAMFGFFLGVLPAVVLNHVVQRGVQQRPINYIMYGSLLDFQGRSPLEVVIRKISMQ